MLKYLPLKKHYDLSPVDFLILFYLIENIKGNNFKANCSQAKIIKDLDIPRTTIYRGINVLVDKKLVICGKDANANCYDLTQTVKILLDSLDNLSEKKRGY